MWILTSCTDKWADQKDLNRKCAEGHFILAPVIDVAEVVAYNWKWPLQRR